MPFDRTSTPRIQLPPFVRYDRIFTFLYFTNTLLQSRMSNDYPNVLEVDYTKIMMAFTLAVQHPRHIVMIGLGGGSLANVCHERFPDARITVAEIDPKVIALRRESCIPEDDHRFQVVEADGADYVPALSSEADVLLVDGYDYLGPPPQLCSLKSYHSCRSALISGGVMAVNLDDDHSVYELYLSRLAIAFDEALVEIAANETGNVIVFSGKSLQLSPAEFRSRVEIFDHELIRST